MKLAERIADFGPTIFSELTRLAQEAGAINLGQGFPDFDGPQAIAEAAIRAISSGVNQYAVGMGAQALRAAIAEHALRFYGQQVDPQTMVSVTSGATEAIFDAILGLVNPKDEVVLFEPFYDSYAASVKLAGGIPSYVPLRPPEGTHPGWWFDEGELAEAFGPRTRLLILNTPHNPTGKVFTEDELRFIGDLCARHDAVVLADEVYEHLAYPPARHVRMATLEGMGERTITISSGGKSFGFTGWKVGWAIAPEGLRAAVQRTHQFVTFATAAPLQAAIAEALLLPDEFFASQQERYLRRRDLLAEALRGAGLTPLTPEGAYFTLADISGTGFSNDLDFCRFLTREVGVAAIPPSAFYGPEHRAMGQRFARFAFCKREETLREAGERLATLPQKRAARNAASGPLQG